MCKLATIGAMIAALAIPATAGAHGTAGRHDRGQIAGLPRAWSSCPNAATPYAAAGPDARLSCRASAWRRRLAHPG
jgi:hypothetical protein